jgi:hypothetical protein
MASFISVSRRRSDEGSIVQIETEQLAGKVVETISESELRRVCDEIHRDRFQVYEFNPTASRRNAVLWMLLGCLISLLSIEDAELQALSPASSEDPYGEVVRRLLEMRAENGFDPRTIVEELLKRVEDEVDLSVR